eukprot:jgi/Ulvmu1/11774/UM008_0188.1
MRCSPASAFLACIHAVALLCLQSVSGVAGQPCKPDCCPTGQFCCGSFCETDGVRPYSACVPVQNGCCLNGANICAQSGAFPAASTPTNSESSDGVATDGSIRGAAGTSSGSVSTGHASEGLQQESGASTSSPCRSDCCITGTFCCGDSCRDSSLEAALTCPPQPACCSNPLLPCYEASTAPAPPTSAPLQSPPMQALTPKPFLIAPMPSSLVPISVRPAIGPSFPTSTAPGTAVPADAPPPGSQPDPACPDGCEAWWARCGGLGYVGPGCCTAGSSCVFKNAGYSNCVPDELDPICSLSGGPSGTVGRFCQCAGAQYFGPQQCGAGLDCVAVNVFYSQCRPVCQASPRTTRGFPMVVA